MPCGSDGKSGERGPDTGDELSPRDKNIQRAKSKKTNGQWGSNDSLGRTTVESSPRYSLVQFLLSGMLLRAT
jgi:hypothetical protein